MTKYDNIELLWRIDYKNNIMLQIDTALLRWKDRNETRFIDVEEIVFNPKDKNLADKVSQYWDICTEETTQEGHFKVRGTL